MAITDLYVNSTGSGSADGSTAANAMSWAAMVTAINAGGTAGNRYNVKGNIGLSASTSITGSGTSTGPVIIRFYTSAIGDAYQGRTNGNGPLITTNMPTLTYTGNFGMAISGSWIIFEGAQVSATARTTSVFAMNAGAGNIIRGCVITQPSTGAGAIGLTLAISTQRAIDCDFFLTGASGGAEAVSCAGNLFGCRISGGPAIGIAATGTSVISGCTVFGSAGNGISMTSTSGAIQVIDNTIVGNTGDGINIVTGSTSPQIILGNLITDNGGYGINGVSAANAILAAYNRLDRNTLGATNLATDWLAATGYGDNTTSVSQAAEYVSYSGHDYRLLATSPAIGSGWPLYQDAGALQHQASGGGLLVHPGMSGGMRG